MSEICAHCNFARCFVMATNFSSLRKICFQNMVLRISESKIGNVTERRENCVMRKFIISTRDSVSFYQTTWRNISEDRRLTLVAMSPAVSPVYHEFLIFTTRATCFIIRPMPSFPCEVWKTWRRHLECLVLDRRIKSKNLILKQQAMRMWTGLGYED
jgi:hypothetical protein